MNYLKNVVTLKLDNEKCIGCGQCLVVCPHGVFDLAEHKARITCLDACMECGACAKNCPVDALYVKTGVGCASGILSGILRGGETCCGEGGCCG
jgi:NAD-dependent dihydropyrimidine dehydrogenase PreA subunit